MRIFGSHRFATVLFWGSGSRSHTWKASNANILLEIASESDYESLDYVLAAKTRFSIKFDSINLFINFFSPSNTLSLTLSHSRSHFDQLHSSPPETIERATNKLKYDNWCWWWSTTFNYYSIFSDASLRSRSSWKVYWLSIFDQKGKKTKRSDVEFIYILTFDECFQFSFNTIFEPSAGSIDCIIALRFGVARVDVHFHDIDGAVLMANVVPYCTTRYHFYYH